MFRNKMDVPTILGCKEARHSGTKKAEMCYLYRKKRLWCGSSVPTAVETTCATTVAMWLLLCRPKTGGKEVSQCINEKHKRSIEGKPMVSL